MKKKNLTYEQALHQLETIVKGFEQGNIGIDQLTEQIREAQDLLAFCKEKLETVENDVKNIFQNEQKQTL